MHCAASLDSAAAILLGCSPSFMCYMMMDSEGGGEEPKKSRTRECSEANFHSVLPSEGE